MLSKVTGANICTRNIFSSAPHLACVGAFPMGTCFPSLQYQLDVNFESKIHRNTASSTPARL